MGVGSDREGTAHAVPAKIALGMGSSQKRLLLASLSCFRSVKSQNFRSPFGARIPYMYVRMCLKGQRNCKRFLSRHWRVKHWSILLFLRNCEKITANLHAAGCRKRSQGIMGELLMFIHNLFIFPTTVTTHYTITFQTHD